MNEIGKAFELMFIGLTVVFINLYLVVLIGNLIIRFVNRYIPEISDASLETTSSNSRINTKKLAALVSAVNIVTNGKGRISKVEKVG
jgi:oxaloacetate decarboxylase gamma subunit